MLLTPYVPMAKPASAVLRLLGPLWVQVSGRTRSRGAGVSPGALGVPGRPCRRLGGAPWSVGCAWEPWVCPGSLAEQGWQLAGWQLASKTPKLPDKLVTDSCLVVPALRLKIELTEPQTPGPREPRKSKTLRLPHFPGRTRQARKTL